MQQQKAQKQSKNTIIFKQVNNTLSKRKNVDSSGPNT